MKKLLPILLVVFFTISISNAYADVIIWQVEANPAGNDAGHEWLTLLNTGDQTVDLDGYKVKTTHGYTVTHYVNDVSLDRCQYYKVGFTTQAIDNRDERVVLYSSDSGSPIDITPILMDIKNDGWVFESVDGGLCSNPVLADEYKSMYNDNVKKNYEGLVLQPEIPEVVIVVDPVVKENFVVKESAESLSTKQMHVRYIDHDYHDTDSTFAKLSASSFGSSSLSMNPGDTKKITIYVDAGGNYEEDVSGAEILVTILGSVDGQPVTLYSHPMTNDGKYVKHLTDRDGKYTFEFTMPGDVDEGYHILKWSVVDERDWDDTGNAYLGNLNLVNNYQFGSLPIWVDYDYDYGNGPVVIANDEGVSDDFNIIVEPVVPHLPTYEIINVTVTTDKSRYVTGDTVRVSGYVSGDSSGSVVGITISDANGLHPSYMGSVNVNSFGYYSYAFNVDEFNSFDTEKFTIEATSGLSTGVVNFYYDRPNVPVNDNNDDFNIIVEPVASQSSVYEDIVVTVTTDKSRYVTGDTVRVSGSVSGVTSGSTVGITVSDANGLHPSYMGSVNVNSFGYYSYAFIVNEFDSFDTEKFSIEATSGSSMAVVNFYYDRPNVPVNDNNDDFNIIVEPVASQEPVYEDIVVSVTTDKSRYVAGDLVRVSGYVSGASSDSFVGITVADADGLYPSYMGSVNVDSFGYFSYVFDVDEFDSFDTEKFNIEATIGSSMAVVNFYYDRPSELVSDEGDSEDFSVIIDPDEPPEPEYEDIVVSVTTDKPRYVTGDTVYVSGSVSGVTSGATVGITVADADGLHPSYMGSVNVDSSGHFSYAFNVNEFDSFDTEKFNIEATSGSSIGVVNFNYDRPNALVSDESDSEDFSVIVEPVVSQEFVYTANVSVTHIVDIPAGTSVPGCEENNSCFAPADITINAGDTVEWINVDTAAHTVTSGSPDGGQSGVFNSGLVTANVAFSFTFDDAGSYDYFCIIHPWMVGTVTVN